ncbi:MAG: glycosyltransferase family 2 protein, partial [Bacteroidales bacterium]|nr:glycosyltransferase family 2 protein [Bacteroidales bacterium]
QREWTGYADQKNSAAALATYNIILSVDADEALSDQLRQSILHLKQTEKQHFVGRLNRLNNYCEKWIRHGGWYPDRKIRIFDRTNAHWTGDVHETIRYSSSDEVITLEGDLFHYSYYSIEEHILKANTFSTIAAMEAFKKNEQVSLFKICIRTSWKMIRDYVCRFGFLDGYYGYVICRINTFGTFLKYIKLYELNKCKHVNKSAK